MNRELQKLKSKYIRRYRKVRLYILGLPMFLLFAPAEIIAKWGLDIIDATDRYIFKLADAKARKELQNNDTETNG